MLKTIGDKARFYADSSGRYLGSFAGVRGNLNPATPKGAVRVPFAPSHVSQIWDGVTWSVHVLEKNPPTMTELVKALSKRDDGDNVDWNKIKVSENSKSENKAKR